MDTLDQTLKRIERWWNGETNGRSLFKKTLTLPASGITPPSNTGNRWDRETDVPDFDAIVRSPDVDNGHLYLGESYPVVQHLWGGRGTPMTMAAYLGGRVVFRDGTVWIDPVVTDWQDFQIKFDETNHWVRMSKALMETQVKKSAGSFLVSMPDLGDALTCMALLRGTEKLLFDVIETPELVLEKISAFTTAWRAAHAFFHGIYAPALPGDCSWLVWAPDKTYTCQCDFSTMISPQLFEKYVVFELEQYKDYLGHIIWHLDGYEEVRHLDLLLELPYINAFQVVTGAGNPPCASDTWLPIIKRITETGRGAYVYAKNGEEFKTLARNLPAERLFIDGGVPGETVNEVETFIRGVFPGRPS